MKFAAMISTLLFCSHSLLAAGFDLRCEGGVTIRGVGGRQIVLDSTVGVGRAWDAPLNRTTQARYSDCMNPNKFVCYQSDDKAMVNIPIRLIRGHFSDGLVRITTDVGDDVPGPAYRCIRTE